MAKQRTLDLTYNASATASAFHQSQALVRGIMGPLGSGKSVACCMEIFRMAQEQDKAPDGFRYSKWLVVRNTLPQLKTTTMRTWFDWIPHDTDDCKMFGPRTYTPPFHHYVHFNDVKLEVIFMALDSEADEERLKSLELTGVYFNEAKYIPFGLVSAAIPRTGRYPGPKMGGCTRRAVIMDTNAPDEDHWWYRMAEEDAWKTDEAQGKYTWEFFKQPSGLAPDADNLEWLNQNGQSLKWPLDKRREKGREYYTSMMAGQSKEWINVNVHGNYGVENTGTAVFKNEWRDDLHYVDCEYDLPEKADIKIGIDCSGRNPSAVFIHEGAGGRIHVFDELVAEGVGAEQFSAMLRGHCNQFYPENNTVLWGDPAGGWGSQTNEKTYNDCLRDQGFTIYPASQGLRIAPRIESTKSVLLDEDGGVRIYKKCRLLRKAFNGAYIYKSFRVNGIDQATHEPDKRKSGRHADVMDAFMYGNIGVGGVRKMRKRRAPLRMTVDEGKWSPWDEG